MRATKKRKQRSRTSRQRRYLLSSRKKEHDAFKKQTIRIMPANIRGQMNDSDKSGELVFNEWSLLCEKLPCCVHPETQLETCLSCAATHSHTSAVFSARLSEKPQRNCPPLGTSGSGLPSRAENNGFTNVLAHCSVRSVLVPSRMNLSSCASSWFKRAEIARSTH